MAKVPNIFRFVKRGRGYFYYELVLLVFLIMNYEQSCKREQNQVLLGLCRVQPIEGEANYELGVKELRS